MKKHVLKFLLALFLFAGWQSSFGQVIISQYYEGPSNDKYIEITNVGSSSIDLSTYYLARWSGTASPSGSATNYGALSGSIAAGETQVYMNSSAVNPTYAVSLASGTTSATYFNGDDPVAITMGGYDWSNVVDCIYDDGTWGSDKAFYRNSDVLAGNTSKSVLDGTGEWTEVSNATVDAAGSSDTEYLGTHVYNSGPDTDAPVLTWDPTNASSDISTTTNITITFNEAIQNIDNSEITDANVASLLVLKETDASGTDIAFTATIDGAKKVITINPNDDLANNQAYYVAIAAVEDASDNATTGENITFTTIASKAEPTNHVTGFTATANTYTNISLAWTDAVDGTQAPDAYLIKASTGSITAPVDGTDPTEDIDLSDGEAIIKVLNDGTQAYSFSGLTAETTYYFQVWSYTNEGTSIDFKLDVTGPEANATTSSSELFFSEYIEGSSNNKALEIFNPTASTVNLDDYMLKGTSNTSSGWEYDYTFPSGATIAPGETYTVVDHEASAEMQALGDFVSTGYEVQFTGNDARGLFKIVGTNLYTIDVVCDSINSTSSNFDVAGISDASQNHTLVRKIGKAYGNTDWTSSAGSTEGDSEWIVLPQDNFNNLGEYRDVERDTTLATLTVSAGTLTPAFDAAVVDYTVELPYGTITVPTVDATVSGTYASKEIVQATNVGGTEGERTATATVTGDDSGTKVYSVIFSVAKNNDATLSALTTDAGTLVPVFASETENYTVELPYGTTTEPNVSATATDANATIEYTQVVDIEGDEASRTATVVVTAEDGTTTKTYTIVYTVAKNNDATLSALTTDDGTLVPVFASETENYTVELPYGTTTEPTVSATATDANASIAYTQVSDIEGDEAARTATVLVTAEDGTTTKTYTVVYSVTPASTDATLSDLLVSGVTITDFVSTTYAYTYELPFGTTETPTVTATENDPTANAIVTPASDVTSSTAADRTTTITVTAEDGTTTQDYTILFNVAANDAKELTNFSFVDPAVTGDITGTDIAVTVPYGTDVTTLVANFSTTGAEVKIGATTQESGVTVNDFTNPVTYTVVAADASTQDYIVTVSIAANTDATLSDIKVNSVSIDGFSPSTMKYFIDLPSTTTVVPTVLGLATDEENATVTVTDAAGLTGTEANRTTSIQVIAADASTTKFYEVVFYVMSGDATLSALSSDAGTLTPVFDAATTEYTIELPYGTIEEPIVSATENDANANAVITQVTDIEGDVAARTATIVVTAEDDAITKTYTIVYSVALNNDATLSALTTDMGTLDPVFDATVTEYTVELPTGTIDEPTVSATATDANASIAYTQVSDIEGDEAARTATILVTAEDGNTTKTYTVVYSVTPAPTGDLFFSEYIEGGSNNKALEIYNPTNSAIDLSDYVIRVNYNGNEWNEVFELPSFTLASKDVYVIGHAEADAEILAETDTAVVNPYSGGTSYIVSYNGDDVRALCKVNGTDTTIIDIIGKYNLEDPGDGWDVAGTTEATKDHTLIRKTSITVGNTDWDLSAGTSVENSEWVVKDKDYTDDLGFHGPKSGTDILTYSFAEQTGAATIDATAHTVAIEVGYGTSPAALVATFTLSEGATAKIGAIDQVSGTTANDFSSAVTYTITAEDGTTQDWVVTVTVSTTQSDAKDILTFTVDGIVGDATIGDGTITATVEYGTDITSLKPAFTVSALATIADTAAARDFTNPQTYVVTAEDASTKDWVVTITAETVTEVSIYNIQYTTDASGDSPEKGNLVKTSGIVTAISGGNLWIQDGAGAWNGVMVYSSSTADAVAIGDEIEFVCEVDEYYGLTELKNVVGLNIISSDNTLPDATPIAADIAITEEFESVLINISVEVTVLGGEHGILYTASNGTATVYVDNKIYEQTGMSVGDKFSITGVGNYSYDDFRISPLSADDITTITGINNPEGIVSVRVFPNPSNGLFTLEMNSTKAGNFDVEIINIQGQVVYTKQINQDGFYSNQINLSNEAQGIYYIRINDGDNVNVSRIVIQ